MEVESEYIKVLINESIKFSNKLSFSPHSEYLSIKQYVDNLPNTEKIYNFQLGNKEGNPKYVQGPYDSDEFALKVIKKLQNSGAEFTTMTVIKPF